MRMDIFGFARMLNGAEYGREITCKQEWLAKGLGFVVVFGRSDDLAEFRGAIQNEVDCYNGGRIYTDGNRYIDAVWCGGECDWTYDTNIPHATFAIYDDDGEYCCKGIVFEKQQNRTNFDRIKAMSVDEMAKFIARIQINEGNADGLPDDFCTVEKLAPGLKKWLESEVTDDAKDN